MKGVSWGYFNKFDDILNKYIPFTGEGKTMALLLNQKCTNTKSRGEIVGYMTLTKDDPNWCNYASSPKYDETVMAKASTVPVTIYPYSISKKELGHSAYWAFDAIDNNGRKDTARTSCYIYNLNKFLYPGWHNQILEMANGWTITDKYPYLIKNN